MTADTPKLSVHSPMNTVSHFAAGSLAGLSADLLVYPLDSLATHAQACSRASSLRALYRGFGVAASLSAPAYAAYFGTYDLSKQLGLHPALAGCTAELAGGLFFVPCEVLKKRAVLGRVGYTHLRHIPGTVAALVRGEGVRALFTGYAASVCGWMPFSALYFWTFEVARAQIPHEYRFRDFFCGGLAGAVAAFVTAPVDLIATRVQTRYNGARSVFQAVRDVVRDEGVGVRPFFRGAQARVVWLAPQAAVTLSVFELLKSWFDDQSVSFREEVLN